MVWILDTWSSKFFSSDVRNASWLLTEHIPAFTSVLRCRLSIRDHVICKLVCDWILKTPESAHHNAYHCRVQPLPLRQFATAPHDDADQVALAVEQGIGCKRHGRPEDPSFKNRMKFRWSFTVCIRFVLQHSVVTQCCLDRRTAELRFWNDTKMSCRETTPEMNLAALLALWILALWPFNCYKQRSRQKEFPIDKVPFSEELWEPMVLTSNDIWRWQHSGKMYEIAVETLRLTYNTYDGSQRIKEECKSSESETKNTSKQRETSWLNFCGNAAGG